MLLMTSCCSICPPKYIDRPIEVKVPVPIDCPTPPQIEPLDDPFKKAKKGMLIEDLIKDLRASRVLWRDRAQSLEILLDAYRPVKKDN